jgi:hypothetical protein
MKTTPIFAAAPAIPHRASCHINPYGTTLGLLAGGRGSGVRTSVRSAEKKMRRESGVDTASKLATPT